MNTTTNGPEHDAQQKLERKALRNVRGLLDKLENNEQRESHAQKRIVLALVAVLALAAGAYVVGGFLTDRSSSEIRLAPPPGQSEKARSTETRKHSAGASSDARESASAGLEVRRAETPPHAGSGNPGRRSPMAQTDSKSHLEGPADSSNAERLAEIERLEAEIRKQRAAIEQWPRKRFIGARPADARFAAYLAEWRAKVLRLGNLNVPKEIDGLAGKVLLTVAIRSGGEIESIDVNKSSADERLDEAIVRMVRLAAPFAPFGEDIRKDTDILYITQTLEVRAAKQRQ